ncbi:cellulase family glycosylhydrolase [bacterium]|nr:cellulase family glycosylhydrolase [bacterium]
MAISLIPVLSQVCMLAACGMEPVRVSPDGKGFVLANSGKPFRVWGVNYDHDDAGRLIEDYWHSEWPTVEADFAEMKALGANVVRIHLQLAKFMKSPEAADSGNLQKLGDLIRLAERTGLYLDLTGLGCYHKKDVPDWYDDLDEASRWQVQARFWKAIAAIGSQSHAIFCYDLMNEPIVGGAKSDKDWLAGELAGKHFVQRITLDLKCRKREDVERAWVETLTDAIREVDKSHMITVGVIPWGMVFPGAKPHFYMPETTGKLDFVSVHFYPKKGEVDKALEVLKTYEMGKPIVIEEIFPLAAGIEETGEFISKSHEFADGIVSFYWGATIDENEKKGDIKGAIVASWLKWFRQNSLEPDGKKPGG